MSQSPPIKFLWGTFCRRAIIDQENGALSVIDAFPGLKSSIQVPKADLEKPDKIGVDLGEFYVASVFERVSFEALKEAISVNLTVALAFPNVLPQDLPLRIDIPAGNTSIFAIARIQRLLIDRPEEEGESLLLYEVQYSFEDRELGVVKMPVIITMKIVED